MDNEKNISYFKGKKEINVDTDFVKSEMAQFLQLDNLNFLIGAGCSSHIVDDKELGIPGMASLYSGFFETYPDFDIAGQMAQPIFNGNLEKMLETMGAISVANHVSTIDGDIENKICVVQNYIREKIISGLHGKEVLDFYHNFYMKTVIRGRKNPVNIFTTNYDLYNEQALDSLSFPYNNGFIGTYNRIFSPASYKYAYVEDMNLSKNIWERVPNFYNLYKIHGSITWVKNDEQIKEIDYNHIDTKDTVMIYPTPLKDRTTLMTPYSDLFRAMEIAMLRKNSVLITLGYSFADDHINRLILNSLAVPTFKLVVFGKSDAIQKLIDMDDTRIIVVNSDDKIHYFKNFVEKAMPDVQEDVQEQIDLPTVSKIIKAFEGGKRMSSREIGKITSIGIHGIIADVNDDLGNYINTMDGIYFVGEVGSYVSIYEMGRTIIAEITGVDEKTLLSKSDEMNKPNSKRQVYLNLVGEIIDNNFYFGVSKMPLIFSEIHMISERDLMTMLEVGTEEVVVSNEDNATRAVLLPIGKSVIFSDYEVKVNIDKFFGFHFAVFGNTGAGKSNTIARILQNIFIKNNYSAKGAKFVIIDSNGEYNKAFSKLNELNSQISQSLMIADDGENENKFEIPVWALSADDWATLLHASERTQIPVLKRAIEIAKVFYNSQEQNNELKNHILASTLMGIINSSDTSPSKADKMKAIISHFGTQEIGMDSVIQGKRLRQAIAISYGQMPDEELVINYLTRFIKPDLLPNKTSGKMIPYSLEQFGQAVEFATLYEGSISSQRIQEYTATLMTRLQTIQEGIQGKLLSKTEYTSIDRYIDSMLGETQIVDIDISMLDDASAEVVTKVLAKLILDYLKRRVNKADMPINFIIEEAHRFVKNETNYGAVGYNIFERIAKEGRKYGMLMGISSQRPSELSKTVVSQCSNFIIHRVQNPDDLQYISRMVPYINQNMINRLTYLQTGHALVFGSAINLPTLTKFEQARPKTDSDNAKISEKWYVD